MSEIGDSTAFDTFLTLSFAFFTQNWPQREYIILLRIERENREGYLVSVHFTLVFSGHLRAVDRLWPAGGEITMLLVTGAVAVGLLVYLFLALLWPERFG